MSLALALNGLWAELKTLGVKEMPRLVFDDGTDWVAASTTLPFTDMPFEKNVAMLCGFRIELARKPVNECHRFVAQEIGA